MGLVSVSGPRSAPPPRLCSWSSSPVTASSSSPSPWPAQRGGALGPSLSMPWPRCLIPLHLPGSRSSRELLPQVQTPSPLSSTSSTGPSPASLPCLSPGPLAAALTSSPACTATARLTWPQVQVRRRHSLHGCQGPPLSSPGGCLQTSSLLCSFLSSPAHSHTTQPALPAGTEPQPHPQEACRAVGWGMDRDPSAP